MGHAIGLGAAAALMAAGAGLIFAAAVGFLRLPDVYARLHAWIAADGAGAGLFLAGLALAAPDPMTALKVIALAALAIALAPTNAHFLAGAAHAGGLAPYSGADARARAVEGSQPDPAK
jgi:multicomponent Na+:H+ antiporter subunit G